MRQVIRHGRGLAIGVWLATLAGLLGASCDDDGPPASPALLDARSIPKFVEPLVIPPVMPPEDPDADTLEYRISVRQFEQQVLPSGLPMTTVWGYGREGDDLPGPGVTTTFNSPAFTVETRTGQRVRVRWVNGLVDDAGRYLPHLLPVDPTMHWANPPGPIDGHSHFEETPGPYIGPVPIVTHVHGAHVADHSDGYPEAWWLPDATDIPDGYETVGTHYQTQEDVGTGAALFEYTNDQRAATLWYHDHALGITRLNVYAGMAGFWLLRDDEEDALGLPGPAPALGDPAGARYYEIPIAIQDRTFLEDGSLYYPVSREEFDGYAGPFVPETEVAPMWNPEFFGTTMMVNGRTWPYLEVEPRLYRFRLLNGSNSRFLILELDHAGLVFTQIGAEGGLLPEAPVERDRILLAPAERADVLVDFSGLDEGDEVLLRNLGPDEPFKGLEPEEPQAPADPETTGLVMQFRVVALTDEGNAGQVPDALPAIAPLTTELEPRTLTLHESMDMMADIPVEAELGTAEAGPLSWDHDMTEEPVVGDTEVWQILNLTGDAHPIHLHLVMFQVVERSPFDAEAYAEDQERYLDEGDPLPVLDDYLTGEPIFPEPWEAGWKDTVIANPGEVTRIIANFDLAGLYAWHCHILEHEDNEMMRPYRVVEAR